MTNSDNQSRDASTETNVRSNLHDEIDHEDNTDGKPLWAPQSWWKPEFRKQQNCEGIYLFTLLVASLLLLTAIALGTIETLLIDAAELHPARAAHFLDAVLLSAGGLLGGTVYGGKWLYHSVARGLWHEDRRLWRLLSPWMSLGTTVGVWALFFTGLAFETDESPHLDTRLLGIGFLIGYFSDRFLAKMKEIANVLFGHVDR